jgi:hypothetical protein
MTRPATSPPDHHTDHDEDGYHGPATLTVDGTDHTVSVRLLGHFQPLDGWYHWYGRVAADDTLDAALGGKRASVRVVTPEGAADGEIADVDPWGRYRLTGTSTPPFTLATVSEVVEVSQ